MNFRISTLYATMTSPRMEFLKHFIALTKILMSGFGNVGHLRLPGTKIHRGLEKESDNEEDNAPDWMVLDSQEDEQRVKNNARQYESWNCHEWESVGDLISVQLRAKWMGQAQLDGKTSRLNTWRRRSVTILIDEIQDISIAMIKGLKRIAKHNDQFTFIEMK